ncbi:hypothetical protein [Thalassotalea fusca]
MQILKQMSIKYTLAMALLSFGCYGEMTSDAVDIPTLEATNIFAHETTLPAVVNYYTKSTVEEISAFYVANYGDITTQETKRGRLMLKFNSGMHKIRVIISDQNKMRQVDVIVTR